MKPNHNTHLTYIIGKLDCNPRHGVHDINTSWVPFLMSWGTCTHDINTPRHQKMGKCSPRYVPKTSKNAPTICTHDMVPTTWSPLDTPMTSNCSPRYQSKNFVKKFRAPFLMSWGTFWYRGYNIYVLGYTSWVPLLISWGTQNNWCRGVHVVGNIK